MNNLRNRGVEDILIAVVDGLKGFPPSHRLQTNDCQAVDAINAAFPDMTAQTCIVHPLLLGTRMSHAVRARPDHRGGDHDIYATYGYLLEGARFCGVMLKACLWHHGRSYAETTFERRQGAARPKVEDGPARYPKATDHWGRCSGSLGCPEGGARGVVAHAYTGT